MTFIYNLKGDRPMRKLAMIMFVAGLVPAAASAQTQKVWKNGVVEAKSDAGFVFMASRGGFAEKQGLNIDMKQFKGDAIALKALLAGELDSYEGSPGSPMLAASRGADIKIVGCYWPVLTYGIFSKAEIKTAADLKGKSIAISAPGALPDLVVRVYLEENKIPSDQVKFVVIGSDADRFRSVSAGIVDAAAASTEFVPAAKKNGKVHLLVHAHEAVPNYLRFCIYMSSKTIASRPDDAAHFLAAEMAGLAHAVADRDAEVKLAKEVTGQKPDDPRAAYIYDEVKRYNAITPKMPIPLDKLNWMQNLLVKTGNLKKPIDIKAMVDDSVRQKALTLVK
jgi:NitT/TauT family transport system substrate-binding protein